MTKQLISDEQLVRFADGRCDDIEHQRIEKELNNNGALQMRFASIDAIGADDLADALALSLSQAPIKQLDSLLNEQQSNLSVEITTLSSNNTFTKLALAACVAGALFIGGTMGYFIAVESKVPGEITNWRESVAVYQMLHTKQTLASVTTDFKQANKTRLRLSKLSGLNIRIPNLEELGLAFKRGQILNFNGSKLVQLAYLSKLGKPVAICFINQAEPNSPLSSELRHGLKVVHWVKNGKPAMVIGDVPQEMVEAVSKQVFDASG